MFQNSSKQMFASTKKKNQIYMLDFTCITDPNKKIYLVLQNISWKSPYTTVHNHVQPFKQQHTKALACVTNFVSQTVEVWVHKQTQIYMTDFTLITDPNNCF